VLKLFVLLMFYAVYLYAYIDPGTGAIVFSFLGALIGGAITFSVILYGFFKKGYHTVFRLIWKKRVAFLFITMALTIIIMSAIILMFFKENSMSSKKLNGDIKRVIALGIDGFDFNIVRKLILEEKLPAFKELSLQGTFKPLTPTIPPQSPVSWSTIATGKNPGEHNIFDFINRNPKNYMPGLSILQKSTTDLSGTEFIEVMKEKPFWEILSSAGVPVSVIRWPVTFPAERINGNLLSGLGVPEIGGLLNRYAYYTTSSEETTVPEDKLIRVEREGDRIETVIAGPYKKKMLKTEKITVLMNITLSDDSAEIEIGDDHYKAKLHMWSDWISVSFRTGILKETSSIFKVYVESIEPEFNMYMTSLQVDPSDPAFKISSPEGYSSKLSQGTGMFYTLGIPEDTQALEDGAISDSVFLQQCKEITWERKKMFWYEFDRFQKGVLAFVFDASDRIQHMFWRHNEMSFDYRIIKLAEEIESHYIEMDSFLGKIIEKKSEDTALFVFSDHGFTSFDYQIDLNRWLVENGFLGLAEEPEEETSWGALYRNVDWSKTKAYAAGFSGIYLNLKGRERDGIVEKEDCEYIKNEIIEKLMALKDVYGNRVIEEVYPKERIYNGKYVANAPDIVVGYRPGYRTSWQTAIGGVYRDVISKNEKKWRGDHIVSPEYVSGIFLSSEKINFERQKLHVSDISSYILKFAGINDVE